MFYFTKIPTLIREYYHQYHWRINTAEKVLYLTFDDGPTPEITDWVLAQLAVYQAKATFFLIGQHIQSHPEIVHRVIDQGHSIGNHSFSHRDGWKTDTKTYLRDFLKCQQAIKEYTGYQTQFYRPPFAHITKAQAAHIMRSHEIIMMDIMSGDFDESLEGEDCFQNVTQNAKNGSIILFHDSKKALPRLEESLPKVLAHFHQKGYGFNTLPGSEMEPQK